MFLTLSKRKNCNTINKSLDNLKLYTCQNNFQRK